MSSVGVSSTALRGAAMRLDNLPVGQLLAIAFRKIGLTLRARLKVHGLTPRQHVVVRLLKQSGPMCLFDIADRLFVDPTSLSRTVHGMAAAGLLKRTAVPGDRRRQLLSLTDAGQRAAAEGALVSAAVTTMMLQGFDDRETETLRALLDRVIRNVPEVDDGGDDVEP